MTTLHHPDIADSPNVTSSAADISPSIKADVETFDPEKVPEVDPLADANRTEEAEHSVSLWESIKDRKAVSHRTGSGSGA